jgi:hypothetical protein
VPIAAFAPLLLAACAPAPSALASASSPLKYLPKRSFKWRAYLSNADHYVDKAPQKGYLTFVVKPPA